MYGYVLWEVLWHHWYLSACIDMVCFMECIGTYCFGMYCMFWNVLVSTDTLFMQVLIRICLYWYVKKKCCALYEFVGVGQSDGWGLVSYDQLTAVLNFVVFNRPEKNLNSTQIILGFLQIQPLQPIGRVQFWVQVQAPACHRLCWRLFQKTLLNQWPSSWSSAPVQLWQVWDRLTFWLVHTNTGCFHACSSHWGQLPACYRETCYPSCNTDSVQESKRFKWYANFGPWLVAFF